jgi:hypothetical protein
LDVIFDAVVNVDTLRGCCDRLSVRRGRDGRDVGVVTKVVEADEPTAEDDGGGIDGIEMCFNI